MPVMSDRWIRWRSNIQVPGLYRRSTGEFVEYKPNEPLMTLADEEHAGLIRQMVRHPESCMIEPFKDRQVRKVGDIKQISSGVSSYGYDVTLSDKGLKLFTNANACNGKTPMVINPKAINQELFVVPTIQYSEEYGAYVLIPPNSYLLGHTVEYFRIPRDILVICLGKSTYARGAVSVNVTPIEPEFKGNVVIEISNLTCLPVMIFVNEGIAQFCFLQGNESCDTSYADRDGKYQGQEGTTDARV